MTTGMRWRSVIGLEVHVQLSTASKMFCRCEARFGAPPNTLICPVCTSQPGTLPVLNAEALRLGVLAGLALDCTVDPSTKFDRKNYFYPDLPKGYQISQFDRPLCRDGHFKFRTEEGKACEVSIVRAHLEEDSGKIIHPEGMDFSLVDLNRAGTPLLEIVTGPDLKSPDEAMAYLQELRRTLRYAGVADCDMEKGGFRCDANISIMPRDSDTLGTRTETKNLNSFRFVAGALQAEIKRQAVVLESGGAVVQETMAYDPDTGRTSVLRSKEDAHDYRYFPEPDLPEFRVDPAWVAELSAALPELPRARHARYVDELGLSKHDADTLVAEKELGDYFEATLELTKKPKETANWLLTELLRLSNDRKLPIRELNTTPARLAELVNLVASGGVSIQAGRLLATALEEQPEQTAAQLAQSMDLVQVSDDGTLRQIVEQVIETETSVVERYRAGNAGLLNALLGSVMKASHGKANPQAVRQLLLDTLDSQG
jgi:aspartyl-tRNA(Asn)/glutamyl-tRNA(Gln) amidotransferase subunit B